MSKQRTGKFYEDLHAWIDEPRQWLKVEHRVERHSYSKAIKDYVEGRWGRQGVIEWLLHIAIDNLDTARKFARNAPTGQREGLILTFLPGKPIRWLICKEYDRTE